MSDKIAMLLILMVEAITIKVVVVLKQEDFPGVNLRDNDNVDAVEAFMSRLPEHIKEQGFEFDSMEEINTIVFPKEDLVKSTPENKTESNAVPASESQVEHYESKVSVLKDRIEKALRYARGCVNSKGSCKPQRIIDDLSS